ncbi:MAG: hypothetical protein RJA24_553 [Pseudomonadota bacterium]|jgi:hypothetical protein
MNWLSTAIGYPELPLTEPAQRRWKNIAALACTIFSLFAVAANAAHGAEIAGVRIDPEARVGGIKLVLNGAGLRQKFMVDVYILGLYIPERTTVAETVTDGAGTRRISLTFLRDVTAQALIEALHEGVRDNSSDAEFAKIKASADALAATMRPLGVAKKGETVALDYLPEKGSQVVMNGQPVGLPIPGRELYRALLRIWLGNSPVDHDLKHALLNGRH